MTKKEEEKEKKVGWFISATPWVGCPVHFNLVVMHDDAKVATEKFRSHFGKNDLEIAACIPIEVVECNDLVN